MKKILKYVVIIFLAGCAYTNSGSSGYTDSNPAISVSSLNNYWNVSTGDRWFANVVVYPAGGKSNQGTIYVDFTSLLTAYKSGNCKEATKKSNYDTIQIRFVSQKPNTLYKFSNGKVWLNKGDRRHNLLPENTNLDTKYLLSTAANNRTPKWDSLYFKYKSPILCNDLDGIIFEMSGIYEGRQELPPIKFRINVR